MTLQHPNPTAWIRALLEELSWVAVPTAVLLLAGASCAQMRGGGQGPLPPMNQPGAPNVTWEEKDAEVTSEAADEQATGQQDDGFGLTEEEVPAEMDGEAPEPPFAGRLTLIEDDAGLRYDLFITQADPGLHVLELYRGTTCGNLSDAQLGRRDRSEQVGVIRIDARGTGVVQGVIPWQAGSDDAEQGVTIAADEPAVSALVLRRVEEQAATPGGQAELDGGCVNVGL